MIKNIIIPPIGVIIIINKIMNKISPHFKYLVLSKKGTFFYY